MSDANGNLSDAFADGRVYLPVVIRRNERLTRRRFWPKVKRFMLTLPFVDDLMSVYFCAMDRRTPAKVRAVMLGALAYFVVPTDLLPDMLLSVGFTDDATVLATAMALVGSHVKDHHRAKSARIIERARREAKAG